MSKSELVTVGYFNNQGEMEGSESEDWKKLQGLKKAKTV